MPNYVHMQVKTKNAYDFSLFMKKLNLAYFHYYRRNYDWVGHFWQDRFKSQPIGKDNYFIQCGKYIELNPVRAGIVNNPEDYSFSSYNYYSKRKRNHLITKDIFYNELGNNIKERQEKYKKMIINESVASSYGKKVWGSPNQCYVIMKQRKLNIILVNKIPQSELRWNYILLKYYANNL
ncbi:MAG: hypothetical protein ACD_58C00330G0003 [uncultured bacterium]|nr:MAG: hypothetical protein ACD_58C00330G0003 [uncultured bacterium]